MIETLYIAETGLSAQQRLIDVISNNIANVSTPGYKKAGVSFGELVAPSQPNDSNIGISSSGKGVHVSAIQLDFRAGDLKQTGNPQDLAINGDGFFPIELPDGEVGYTRGGRLQISEDGFLTTADGYRFQANIQIPPDATDFTVTQTGGVLCRVQGSSELIELGKLDIVRFNQPEALRLERANVFKANDDSGNMVVGGGGDYGNGTIYQGFIEMSNVSMNEEMVNLMLAQRGYQINARLVQVADQVLETINNIRR